MIGHGTMMIPAIIMMIAVVVIASSSAVKTDVNRGTAVIIIAGVTTRITRTVITDIGGASGEQNWEN
jgi:hypothetical protein